MSHLGFFSSIGRRRKSSSISSRINFAGRRLRLESLESRRMLAVFHVSSSLLGNDANTGGVADPFRTIGAGISAAATADDGADEVRVEAGTYNTALVDLPVTIAADAELDNLTLSGGWNAAFTLQTGTTAFTPQAAGDAVGVTDDDVTISDITITGASGAGSDGIDAASSNSLILVNVISTGHAADGLHASGVAAVSITNSTLSTNGDDGIDVAIATTVALNNLSLAGNADDGGVLAAIGTVTYTASTGATPDIIVLSDATLERTAPAQQAIAYSAVTTLIINTGDGDDSISISGTTAGTSVAVNLGAGDDAAQIDNTALLGPVSLDGGTQTTEDTFDYNLNATGVTLTATTITAAGSQAVTLANFENQNFDGAAGAIPSIAVNHSAAGGTTTLASGATADAGTITPAGGTAYSFFALAAGATIGVNGSIGDDALAFVNSGATLLAANVTFAGGAQVTADALSLSGAGNVVPTVVHTATGVATGNISLNLGTLTITYSGLEPVLDTLAAAAFTFNTPADTADRVAYENGAVPGNHRIRSTNGGFETTEFANKTNVTINTGTGAADLDDIVTVITTQTCTGLTSLSFTTGADADSLSVNLPSNGGVAIAPFSIDLGGGADTLAIDGTAGNDSFTITATTVTLAPQTITYNNTVETLDIDGLAGNDSFDVTPSPDTTIDIDGGAHTTGDSLDINVGGLAVTLTTTSVTLAGRRPVVHANCESFSLKPGGGAIPSIVVNHTAAGGTTTLTSGATANSGTIQVQGGPTFAFSGLAPAAPININGNVGDDRLAIVNSGATLLSANVTFAGGAQVTADALSLSGAGNVVPTVVHTATGAATGNISLNLGTLTIAYSGLEPILDTLAATNFTFTTTADTADSIAYENGATLATTHQIRSTSAAFETYEFSGKTNVIVDTSTAAADLADTIAVGFTQAATGLATLRFDTGAGADVVNIRTTQAGTTTTINAGNGNDIINVGNASNSLVGIAGALTVNGDGNAATPTASYSVSALGVTVSNTLPIGDVLNINDSGDGAANTYTLSANDLVRNAATLVTFGPATTVETINLSAGTNTDTINVTATPASVNVNINTTAGGDAVNVTTTGATSNVVINGDAATNLIAISNTGAGSVTIVNAGGGTDTLSLDNSGAASLVVLNGEAADDALRIRRSGAASIAVVNGGDGNDTIDLGNPGNSLDEILGVLSIDGQANLAATTTACAGTDAATVVTVGDTINVLDQDEVAGNTYLLSANTLARNGATTIAYFGAETIVLNTGTGGDNITVNGPSTANHVTVNANAGVDAVNVRSTVAGSATEITGGAGNDFITIGSATNSLSTILGAVCVDGGASDAAPTSSYSVTVAGTTVSNSQPVGDVLLVNDQGNATGTTYVIDADSVQRTLGPVVIAFAATETLALNAGAGTDTINVATTAAAQNVTINTTGGGDTVNVTTTGPNSNLIVNGDSGVNPAMLSNTGAASVAIVNASGGGDTLTLAASGAASLVVLNGEAGTDTINVRTTAFGSIAVVNGGDDNDTINVGNANSLDGILGALYLDGQAHGAATTTACAGTDAATVVTVGDTLNINDQTDATGNAYFVNANTITRGGATPICYFNIETLNLNAGDGEDFFELNGASANHVTVNTGGGADKAFVLDTPSGSATEVNGGAGNDWIVVGSEAKSLSTIQGAVCVDGGASDAAPASSFSVTVGGTTVSNSQPVGDTLLVNDQGNGAGSTYAIDADSLQRTAGSAVIAFAATETLTLNAGTGTDLINIATTAAAQNVVVNTTSGGDTVNVTTTGASSNLIVNGDSGVNAVTLSNTGAASVAIVNASGGGDTLTLAANGAASLVVLNGEVGTDTINLLTTAPGSIAVVNGGDDNDTINVGNANSLDGIGGVLFLDGQANGAATTTACAGTPAATVVTIGDTLNILDQGDASGNVYSVNANAIGRVGAAVIGYFGLETLNLNAGDGVDSITFNNASPNPNHVVISAAAGADAINMQATPAGSGTEIAAGAGNDFIQLGLAGSLDGILGNVCVQGDANEAVPVGTYSATCDGLTASNSLPIGDVVFVDDAADANPATYTVTPNSIQRNDSIIATGVIAYDTTETITVSAGTGADTIDVAAAASVNTNINTTAGGDTVNVTSVGAAANLIVNGDAAGNIVNVTVGGTTGVGSVAIVNGGGGGDTITFGGVGAAALAVANGEDGGDTIDLRGSAASSVTIVNGGAGNDTINVGNAVNSLDGVLGATCVFGGAHDAAPTRTLNSATFTRNAAPVQSTFANTSSAVAIGDTLNLLDGAHASSADYTITSTNVSRVAGPVKVNYQSIESLRLEAGIANDKITVQMPSGAPALPSFVNVDAGGGADDELVINGTAGSDTIVVGSDGANLAAIQVAGIDCAHINGGAGADTIVANRLTLPAQLQGTQQVAVVVNDGGAGDDNILGSQSVDHITAGADNDLVFGEGGNDLVEGQAGNDELHGGEGNDILRGGDGNDYIFGELGSDLIEGEGDNDELHGGDDVDRIFGGDGLDNLFGEDGDDFLFADQNLDGSIVPAPSGVGGETVDGGAGSNSAVALGADNIFNITNLLFTDAGKLDVISWLKANFQTSATPVYEAAKPFPAPPVDC